MDGTDFHSIYQAHAAAVHGFALYLTGRREDADEITAETFLRAWTATAPIRETTARSYLIAIARNLVIDHQRRRRREREIPPDWPSRESSPHQRLEFELTLEAIHRLPVELSLPLTMSALGGLSYEQIAAALRIPLSTVKIRIYRGRLRLADELNRKRSASV
jgi:RNA polymerase sigma-70 factor (ECF subfamily)